LLVLALPAHAASAAETNPEQTPFVADGAYPIGDINQDCRVDYKDLAFLGAHYGETTSPPYPAWDINQDGKVDYKDLAIVGARYGETCVTEPNFRFLGVEKVHKECSFGMCTVTIGMALENTGGAGYAYVAAADGDSGAIQACNVFHLNEGEKATVWVYFGFYGAPDLYWTVRIASSGDTFRGRDMWLERGDGTLDQGLYYLLLDAWGSSSSDVFAVGKDGLILHYDGQSWEKMTSGTSQTLTAVWGSSSSDVFSVGASGTILHYDGNAAGTWITMNSGTTKDLGGVWGVSSSQVVAVGDSGTAVLYDGTSWTPFELFNGRINDVWISTSKDIFALVSNTVCHYRYSAAGWELMPAGTTATLWAVWGFSSSDVFAVGNSGTIVHYNGTSLESMTSGTSETLAAVWGSSATDVFAVSGSGTVLRYNGATWSEMTSLNASVQGIWGNSSSDVFILGKNVILHYDGHSWEDIGPHYSPP